MTDTFDTFWSDYPRKDGKAYARKCYAKAVKAHGAATILQGLQRFKAQMIAEDRDKKHIMQASRFLNQAVYLDDHKPEAPTPASTSPGRFYRAPPSDALLPDADITRRWVGGIAYTWPDVLAIKQRMRAGMAVSAVERAALAAWER